MSLVNVAKKSLLSSKLDELQAKETYKSLKISLQASSMPVSKTLEIFLHFLSTTRCLYRSENLLTYSKKKSKKQQNLLQIINCQCKYGPVFQNSHKTFFRIVRCLKQMEGCGQCRGKGQSTQYTDAKATFRTSGDACN